MMSAIVKGVYRNGAAGSGREYAAIGGVDVVEEASAVSGSEAPSGVRQTLRRTNCMGGCAPGRVLVARRRRGDPRR